MRVPSVAQANAARDGTVVGRVAELWRYPVKSLGGERLETAEVDRRGLVGDRRYAVIGSDGKIGSGKSTRRFRRMPGLLSVSARTDADGTVRLSFPTGEDRAVDDPRCGALLGALVGEEVGLSEEGAEPYFDAAPLHVVSRSSLAWLQAHRGVDEIDRRRFRPNVLVDTDAPGRPEDEWVGGTVSVGSVTVRIERLTVRCVMVTMTQDELGFAPGILRELRQRADECFGVYATLVDGGSIRVGDPLLLLR